MSLETEAAETRAVILRAVLVTVAIRALVIAWLRPPPSWDGAIYAALAESLARGDGYVHWDGSGRATAFFPVGFPAAIAGVKFLVGGTQLAVYVVNVAASALATAAAGSLGARLGGTPAAKVSAWWMALYPGLVLWSAAAMTETLQGALVTAAMAAALAQRPRDPWLRAALSGALIGLASFVRPQSIVLAPVLGALAHGDGHPRIARASGALLSVCCALVVIAPWSARNARALDGFALVSTNGGSNLLIGVMPDANGGYRALTATAPCADVRGEVRRDQCMAREARARVRAEPLRWSALAARKVARTMAFEWAPVSYARSTVGQRISMPFGLVTAALCTVAWWATMLLGATGARAAFERAGGIGRRAAIAVLAAVASVVLIHGAFIADDRYHLGVVGPLAASLGWWSARRSRDGSERTTTTDESASGERRESAPQSSAVR